LFARHSFIKGTPALDDRCSDDRLVSTAMLCDAEHTMLEPIRMRTLTEGGRHEMSTTTRIPSIGVAIGFLLTLISSAFPSPVRGAWVNPTTGQFNVGGQLYQFNLTNAGNPLCTSTKGGTSLALVQGFRAGLDPILNPVVLVVSCLDSNATNAAKLYFINPVDGAIKRQLSTSAVPSNGWGHLVLRPDKGDLLGCGANGAVYKIDFLTGVATALAPPFPANLTPSCAGLAWDPEADTIYMGLDNGSSKIGEVISFKEGATSLLGDFKTLPCTANGLAISGGVLLMSCVTPNNPSATSPTMLRVAKTSGVMLGVFGQGSAADPSNPSAPNPFHPQPGLGDLACDPVSFSFQKDATGNVKDLYTDAVWSRVGATGNSVVALEFPAFTCGLPSTSVVGQNPAFSPLAAGLSRPGPTGLPGQLPLVGPTGCFDQTTGAVIDSDGDGLPDCWEGPTGGIDFDGNGTTDLTLCVQVNTNGDGVTLTPECALPNRKDLFVEIDYMQNHKPDPLALSQPQSAQIVGVKSVREAFAAAPVKTFPTDATPSGIKIHFQVDEQVSFPNLAGINTNHVTYVALTPCTASANTAPPPSPGAFPDAADFDVIKAVNFGTLAERLSAAAGGQVLNAKRLAFRYVLFAHNLVGVPPGGGGSNSSGCSEIGGDDAVVSLGSFSTINGHGQGNTDEQAGTFMHEFGHLLGLRHGGDDGVNCKPNYRSVMSYPRQFSGSPIQNRRLDYSRHQDLDLDETALNECVGIGSDPSLGPIPAGCVAGTSCLFSADQIAFGPGAWSLATPWPPPTAAPSGCTLPAPPAPAAINWNRVNAQGKTFQTGTSADLNGGATTGCDTSGALASLAAFDDWQNLLYRASASLEFAGGARSDTPKEMTKENEVAFFNLKDADGNGVGDAIDCGGAPTSPPEGSTTNSCTHRIDIKPSFPFPKTLNLGTEANVTIAIFSEQGAVSVWSAPGQVLVNDQVNFPLTFSVGSVVEPVKTNQNGQGTCSISDVADPITGQKDGIKDLKCQFSTSGLPTGTNFGVVSGFFSDPVFGPRAFSARQQIIIMP
jgi:hypothetical protein